MVILKRFLAAAIAITIAVCTSTQVFADDGRRFIEYDGIVDSYTYGKSNGSTKVISSPDAYIPDFIVNSDTLKTELNNPSHITEYNDSIYIVNTGKNNIIVTDKNFKVRRIISGFYNAGKLDTFSSPQGCCIASDGSLYIADTENKRIVVLDGNDELVRIISQPESDVFADDFVFKPQKIAVDSSYRIFVVADGVYEGIMQFYNDGSFIGFIGSIPVSVSPLELIWKRLLSKEQNSKRSQFVPVSYTNIFLDVDEFMYTVSLSTEATNPIRRLNPGGDDVLARNALADTAVNGDQIGKTSQFSAVCADNNGIYYAADLTNSRIFIYDEDGNLLCVMGGNYTGQIGTYKYISSLLISADKLLVVDAQSSVITALAPTEYMKTIRNGLKSYRSGAYEESYGYWKNVLELNSNFDLAYSKIGMIEMRKKNYSDAMLYFKTANDQKNYSKAYAKYRSKWYTEHLSVIITVIILVAITGIVTAQIIKRRKNK